MKRPLARILFGILVACLGAALLILLDDKGTLVLASALAEKVFGYLPNELVGQPIEILIPDRFRTGHVHLREDFMKNPTSRQMGSGRFLRGRKKDGSEIPIEVGLAPLKIGEELYILTTVIDITERMIKEAELREVASALTDALEIAELGTYTLDVKTKKMQQSLRHGRIFGYSTLQPEWTYERERDHVVPEDRKIFEAQFATALANGTAWHFECRIRRADGALRWIEARGKAQWAQNSVVGFVGLVKDVTEAKFEEQQRVTLAAIIRNSDDAIIARDARGTIISWNVSFFRKCVT